MKNFLIPRLRDVFFLAILFAALALGPRMLSLDSDLGRHLTLGGFILDSHQIPIRDLFSHIRADAPRPAYEWLMQVIFALANRLVGLDGVLLVTALVIAAAFAVVYVDAARRSRFPLAALMIASLAAAASSLHWLPRPHVITFLLLAIWLEWLEHVRCGESVPWWQFPALMLIWANAHGGFLFGILAWLAYFGGWMWEAIRKSANPKIGKQWLLIGGSSLLASILTPSGWGNWQAVLANHSSYILSRTVETRPPDFSQPGTWPFALLLGITIIIILATRKDKPAAQSDSHFAMSHVFLLAGFAALGLLMARNIPLFAIAVVPILSERARNVFQRAQRWETVEANVAALESPLRGAVWPITFGLALTLFIGIRFQTQKEALARFDGRVFPVAAADWLNANPQSGNMFNDINWGGYLLYRLWPGQKVFVDSQTDFYGEALTRKYEQVVTLSAGWENVLSKYNVTWVILPPDVPLASALRDTGWHILYSDSTTVILKHP